MRLSPRGRTGRRGGTSFRCHIELAELKSEFYKSNDDRDEKICYEHGAMQRRCKFTQCSIESIHDNCEDKDKDHIYDVLAIDLLSEKSDWKSPLDDRSRG